MLLQVVVIFIICTVTLFVVCIAVLLQVVVIFIICTVTLLVLYMLFLLCLDPFLSRRPKSYVEQQNEEVSMLMPHTQTCCLQIYILMMMSK